MIQQVNENLLELEPHHRHVNHTYGVNFHAKAMCDWDQTENHSILSIEGSCFSFGAWFGSKSVPLSDLFAL